MELGANDFLTKPFSPKKLYARAAALVGLGADDTTADGA
jgi:DNA-binding response OmpR family regulator